MGLVDSLRLDQRRLQTFFRIVCAGYHIENPYHNFFHAMQVYEVVFCLLWRHDLSRWLYDAERLGVLIGALSHDVDHPGLTNAFFIATNHPKALIYNDQSVLEHHHAAYVFQAFMLTPACDFRISMSKEDSAAFRRSMIAAILGTDMHFHNQILSTFSDRVQKHVNDLEPLSLEKDSGRECIIKMVVHAADISNQLMTYPHFKRWGSLICEEFLSQCDREAAVGLAVTPFMNVRTEIAKTQMQIGFQEFVVSPLWRALSILAPTLQPILQQAECNSAFWQESLEILKSRDAANALTSRTDRDDESEGQLPVMGESLESTELLSDSEAPDGEDSESKARARAHRSLRSPQSSNFGFGLADIIKQGKALLEGATPTIIATNSLLQRRPSGLSVCSEPLQK